MSIENQSVLIVGAGIGGLAAAIALAQRGAAVTVLEQAAEISEVGAGLQITPNGGAVLRAFGLADDLAWRSMRSTGVVLRHHAKGREIAHLDFEQYAPDLRFYFVHRADLIALLQETAQALGVRLLLNKHVIGVEADQDPSISLARGADIDADIVLGADGLHSQVFKALNEASDPFFTGQVAWRAIVPNSMGLRSQAQVFMGPGRHLVAYPLRDGSMVNLVAVMERKAWAEEGWSTGGDADELRHAFSMFGGDVRGLLSSVEDVALWGLFRHEVARYWCKGRVGLLGDAAHPTLPFMAQGANLALEDAWELAQCLDAAGTPEEGLKTYEGLRRSRAERVVAAANGNAWKFHLKRPFAAPAHFALSCLSKYRPEKLVRQFDWIYRHNEMLSDPRRQ